MRDCLIRRVHETDHPPRRGSGAGGLRAWHEQPRRGGAGGGADGGDTSATWNISLRANLYAAAYTLIGTNEVSDTGTSDQVTFGTRTFHSVQSSGGSSAEATLAATLDEHQLTLTGTLAAAGASASGTVRDLTFCVTAPGATKVRITYGCSATPDYSVKGIAAMSVVSGPDICVISKSSEEPPEDRRGTLVRESTVINGKACDSGGVTFYFGAGGTGGSASLSATATMRFEPVY